MTGATPSAAAESLVRLAGRAAPPGPAFLAELRRAGRERFEALGLPTTRLEDWRYTSLSGLLPLAFAPVDPEAPLAEDTLVRLAGPPAGPRLVFVNGRYRPALSSVGALPPGAFAGSLSQALRERPGEVEPHLGRVDAFQDRAFAALNAAAFEDGAAVLWPERATLAEPVELVFVTASAGSAPAAVLPRVLVVAGAGSELSVAESHLGQSGGPTLAAAVTEVVVGEGARVDHYRIQDDAPQAFHLGSLASRQAQGSRFSTHALALGALLSRSEVRAVLAGEGGEARVNGLYLAGGRQLVDNLSLIEHARPRCVSRETFKGVLDGESRAVFGGRIRVLEGAQKSDAYQLNSNLLLSEGAEVDTKPQLEIFADDVKCGHGGTVGQLDEEALFYLRTRGIARERARGLLIYAFASEMVELVRPGALRDRVARLVAARLPEGERILEAA
ncbi:MAG TPA: Fe-S cluster assembly protein SufD [Anaeromyxobacteraceae bacterium]|nr:Fe-S cluster assembly protein SufD [Anaeromyxobacteraceae bacterium]